MPALSQSGAGFLEKDMKKKVFDTLISYYQPTRTADSFGQKKEVFTEFQKAFVSLENRSGDEDIRAERVEWTGVITLLGHYVTGVDTTFRVLYDGDYYNIVDVEPVDRKRWMKVRIEKITE